MIEAQSLITVCLQTELVREIHSVWVRERQEGGGRVIKKRNTLKARLLESLIHPIICVLFKGEKSACLKPWIASVDSFYLYDTEVRFFLPIPLGAKETLFRQSANGILRDREATKN